MGLENERKLLKYSKQFFNFAMLNPHNRMRRKFSIVSILTINTIVLYLSFILVEKSNYTLSSVSTGVRSVTGFVQLYPKLLLYIIYENELQELDESMNNFWTIDTNINDDTFAMGFFVAQSFRLVETGAAVVIWLCPLITNNLFFEMWVPDFKGAFIMVWFLQSYQMMMVICIVVSVDLLFISSCVSAIGQLNILNYNIEKLKSQDDGDMAQTLINLKKYIEHHKFILSYIGNLVKCFSLSLFVQYLTSMCEMCIVLYAISDLEENFEYITNLFLMAGLTTQLACYCFPADAVIEAANKTSTALYSCEWYNFPIPIQKDILQVMTCVQKDLVISAGGLMYINKQTFTMTLKGAFTLYTAIKELQNKDK